MKHDFDGKDLTELLDLVDTLGTCMLITRDGEILRSRPMHPIAEKTNGEIRFLFPAGSAIADEVSANPACNMSFVDLQGHRYLSVSGDAQTSRDLEEIKKSWTDGAEIYFPNGPAKSDVVLLRVRPTHAEYWENDSSVVKRAWNHLKAKLTGSRPEHDDSAKLSFKH